MLVTHQLIISKAAVHAPLKEWIGIYADQLASDTTFTAYTDKRGYQAIRWSEVLNDDLFFYLVNSLAEACEPVMEKPIPSIADFFYAISFIGASIGVGIGLNRLLPYFIT